MEAIITTLTSSIGIGTLVFFLLKSFLGEKFKNMATLQDIGSITREVESVKQIFANQTEELKQELSVLTNKHNVLFNEEKEALYAYLSAWLLWMDNIDNKSSTFISNRQYKDLTDVVNGLNEMHSDGRDGYGKVLISISKIELFVSNIVLNQTIFDLNKITGSYQAENEKYIEAYMWNNHNWLTLVDELKVALPEDRVSIAKEIQANRTEMKALKVAYDRDRQTSFNKVLFVKDKFILLSKAHIRKDL